MKNPAEEYMPKQNGLDYNTAFNTVHDRSKIFDTQSKSISVQNMGLLPMCTLNHPLSVRGNHPINSFKAVGEYAQRLTETQNPQEVYAPFKRLMEDDGYILLMGVELDRATIIHYAEQLAEKNLFICWANDRNGVVIPIPGGGCSRGFTRFKPMISNCKSVLAGDSLWQCYKATEIVEICKNAIIQGPNITHCDNPNCISCNDAVLGGPLLDGQS